MDSNFLARKAFSLAELSIVLAIITVLTVASFYLAGKIRQVAQAQRVLKELDAIADASLGYYSENGAWPANLSDLRPKYLAPQASDYNPFGNAYVITGAGQKVSVSTLLPKGLVTERSFGSEVVVINQGNNDLVSITKSVETRTWKLKYDKKYIYHQ